MAIKVKDIIQLLQNIDQEKFVKFEVPGSFYDYYKVDIIDYEKNVEIRLMGEDSDDDFPQDILLEG